MNRLALKLIALLVLLTGLPLAVAWWQSGTLFERTLGAGLNPVVGTALQDAVQIYGDFVASEKARQRAVARGLADSRALAQAAAQGRPALEALLRPIAAQPRVQAVTLTPLAGPPLRVAGPPMPADAWLLDGETLPLTDVPGYTHLRFEYGLEREILTRFERMEADVIRPFAALAADRANLADIYAYSFVGSLAVAVLLAGLIAVVVGRRLTRRLSRLREGMARVASGERGARVEPAGHDELADLARGFNDMAQRLQDSHARVQYLTQVSAWQGIARRLAHEIKNPLTPILL
ncbi:MAG: HAMP domain-containing protein, partial [Myxococcales bacterium]|nr:HAMP domain-containing protein [Myxococcales bacterium]